MESVGIDETELRRLYLERMELKGDAAGDVLTEMLGDIAARYGVSRDDVHAGRRSGAHSEARKDFFRSARAEGFSDAAIARALQCSKSAVSQMGRRS